MADLLSLPRIVIRGDTSQPYYCTRLKNALFDIMLMTRRCVCLTQMCQMKTGYLTQGAFVAGSLVRVGRLLGLRRYGFLLWGFLLRYLLRLTGRCFLSRSFHVSVTALAWRLILYPRHFPQLPEYMHLFDIVVPCFFFSVQMLYVYSIQNLLWGHPVPLC